MNVMSQKCLAHFFALSTAFCASQLYAIQPINDVSLSNTVGEQSPIKHLVLSDQENTSGADSPNIESTLVAVTTLAPNIQQQVEKQTIVNLTQQQHKNINLIERQLPQTNNLFVSTLHHTSELNFGLEGISMTWNGNFEAMVDLEKISFKSFNNNTGEYELDNVRGQVIVVAMIH